MSESKHTPGPWRVNSLGPARIIYDGSREGWAIADVKTYHGRHAAGQAEANAHLIAAAPDMLESVKRMRWLCSELHAGNSFSRDDLLRWLEEADSAIRRAENK